MGSIYFSINKCFELKKGLKKLEEYSSKGIDENIKGELEDAIRGLDSALMMHKSEYKDEIWYSELKARYVAIRPVYEKREMAPFIFPCTESDVDLVIDTLHKDK